MLNREDEEKKSEKPGSAGEKTHIKIRIKKKRTKTRNEELGERKK